MLFNSQIFILIFFPICLLGWYLINEIKKYDLALLFLVGMSLWFYGYFNPRYLLILIGSVLVNYTISALMKSFEKRQKLLFFVGLIFNICLLGYYKYYDFFIENINAVFKSSFALKNILLPLGISFFTLQQISFIIDRYIGLAEHYRILDYLAYVTFFPQLIAGPIVLHGEIIPQFQDISLRKFDKEKFRSGLVLFILGLAKKVIIADTFAYFANFGFEHIFYVDMPSSWFVALGYTFELYFDFSGYCDMACGIGRMFNYELPVNFKSPYKAYSISNYWSRWHATLTRFFTTYIYTPLTIKGMRKKKKNLYAIIAPMVVFFISGFWHGASWTFIIWGILYGLATLWGQRKFLKIKKNYRWLGWLGTFVFTIFTMAIFRSETMDNMFRILKGMVIPRYTGFMREVGEALNQDVLVKPIMLLVKAHVSWAAYYWICFANMCVLFAIGTIILIGKNAHEIEAEQRKKGYTVGFTIFLSLLFAWCLISLSEVSTFLYFNF